MVKTIRCERSLNNRQSWRSAAVIALVPLWAIGAGCHKADKAAIRKQTKAYVETLCRRDRAWQMPDQYDLFKTSLPAAADPVMWSSLPILQVEAGAICEAREQWRSCKQDAPKLLAGLKEQRLRRCLASNHPCKAPQRRLYLVVVRSATAADVHRALKLAGAAGYEEVGFVLRTNAIALPKPLDTPYFNKRRRELSAYIRGERMVFESKALSAFLRGRCLPAFKVMQTLSGFAPYETCADIAKRLPDALATCGGRGMNRTLTSLLVKRTVDEKSPVAVRVVRTVRGDSERQGTAAGGAVRLSVKATATWPSFAKQVIAAHGKPFWLHLK